jgi:hypothetical protein
MIKSIHTVINSLKESCMNLARIILEQLKYVKDFQLNRQYVAPIFTAVAKKNYSLQFFGGAW